MTLQEARKRLDQLSPWFYEFDLGAYGKTRSDLPPQVLPIHQTRLAMVENALERQFGRDVSRIRCLDVGCHEGFYSVAMARKGMLEVHGVDVRPASIAKAKFIASLLGMENLRFSERNCEDLSGSGGPYELCLFLGVLYHLENPMLCLRNIAAATSGVCILETQVAQEVDGEVEWGSRDWTRPYQGVLALIDESDEYFSDRPETGASPLAMCPSPKALQTMLTHAGFRSVEILEPPAGAYEQMARRKRLICVAYK